MSDAPNQLQALVRYRLDQAHEGFFNPQFVILNPLNQRGCHDV
jgi:hypothetical protein